MCWMHLLLLWVHNYKCSCIVLFCNWKPCSFFVTWTCYSFVSVTVFFQNILYSCYINPTGMCLHQNVPLWLFSLTSTFFGYWTQSRATVTLVQVSSLKFLLQQGLAFRGHDELEGNLMQLLLLHVHAEDRPELKQWIKDKKYLSPQITNELIKIMSNQFLR